MHLPGISLNVAWWKAGVIPEQPTVHNGVQFQDGDTASTGSAIRLTTLVQLHNPRFWDLRRRVNPEILNFAVQVT